MKRSLMDKSEKESRKKTKLACYKMDQIIKSPGLQHVIENIFLNLDFKDLLACQFINKTCKQILANPMFWLKKWRFYRGLSKKNEEDWIKAIQMTKGTIFEKNILLYIKRVIKTGHFVDVPCYIDSTNVLEKSRGLTFSQVLDEFIVMLVEKYPIDEDYYGILQLLAPLVENFNGYDFHEEFTPIHIAVLFGDIDMIKIFAAITENPNEKRMIENEVDTPISIAAAKGHMEVIKFLVPLTKYPNIPDDNGNTPIHKAVHKEIIKILVSAANVNPNVENNDGFTAFDLAIMEGHLDIVKILAPLAENLNTPIEIATEYAAFNGYVDIVKYLTSLTKHFNVPDENGKTPLDLAKSRDMTKL